MPRRSRPLLPFLLLLLLLLLLPSALSGRPQRPVGGRSLSAHVDSVLAQPELLDRLLVCLLAENDDPCSPKGTIVKGLIRNKVRTDCAGCTEDQNRGVVRLLSYLSLYREKDMRRLLTKNDPTGYFIEKYSGRWTAEGIVI